jgi:hypothetical protein
MSNSLTGDFEAVLQVSGGTVDRLLAGMHQNAFADPKLPSFPHVASLRLGDQAQPGDTARGTVKAQISTPRIELIDGSTDRFVIEFAVRAHFVAEAGNESLPEFINGTVRAEYEIADLSECPGWRTIAHDYLWVRVVEDSVSFTWDTDEGSRLAQLTSRFTHAHHAEAIEAEIIRLLKGAFTARPHPLRGQFQQRLLRSLVAGDESAVVVPTSISSAQPAGNIASVNEIVLNGRDFAVAVSSEAILAAVEPSMDEFSGLELARIHWSLDLWVFGGLEIDYVITLDSATVEWIGPGVIGPIQAPGALLNVRLTGSGRATRIYTSGVAELIPGLHELDARAEGRQLLMLSLNPVDETLALTPVGPPSVDVQYGGPFADDVKPRVRDAAMRVFPGEVAAAVAQVEPKLAFLTRRKAVLTDQLVTFDRDATARLEEAEGAVDGLILRGMIGLSPRKPPALSFKRLAQGDGYDATASWIPGGRVDEFEWSWEWAAGPLGRFIYANQNWDGGASFADRFLLRSSYLGQAGHAPLPGIDGMPAGTVGGQVCLNLKGEVVDPRTGEWMFIQTGPQCVDLFPRVGQLAAGRLLWARRSMDGAREETSERALLDVAGGASSAGAANTMLLYLDRGWDDEAVSVLRDGLAATTRDAGILVVALFPERVIEGEGDALGPHVRELAQTLRHPLVVNEDVRASWSARFALPVGSGECAWRLISPGGGLAWAHDGPVDRELLASVLDACLGASPPARAEPGRNVGVGRAVGAGTSFDLVETMTSECPVPPWFENRPDRDWTITAFVQAASPSSEQRLVDLERERGELGDAGVQVSAIVDGATAEEADALKNKLGLEFDVLPDPGGAISNRFGIRIWPTTLTVDRMGRVAALESGLTGEMTQRASAR